MRCCVPSSVRLLRLDFDFTPMLSAAMAGQTLGMPEARETLMVVGRNHYRVCAHVLDPWAFALLGALAGSDGVLWTAMQAAADYSGLDLEAITADLLLWLPFAVERGLLGVLPA